MTTTYRLGSIDGGNRRPLIANDTDAVVSTVVSMEGPAIMGDMTLEQVQGHYGVLLAGHVSLVTEETESSPAVYAVDLTGRPKMHVTAAATPYVEGFRRDTADQRLALAAVRDFTDC